MAWPFIYLLSTNPGKVSDVFSTPIPGSNQMKRELLCTTLLKKPSPISWTYSGGSFKLKILKLKWQSWSGLSAKYSGHLYMYVLVLKMLFYKCLPYSPTMEWWPFLTCMRMARWSDYLLPFSQAITSGSKFSLYLTFKRETVPFGFSGGWGLVATPWVVKLWLCFNFVGHCHNEIHVLYFFTRSNIGFCLLLFSSWRFQGSCLIQILLIHGWFFSWVCWRGLFPWKASQLILS